MRLFAGWWIPGSHSKSCGMRNSNERQNWMDKFGNEHYSFRTDQFLDKVWPSVFEESEIDKNIASGINRIA